MKSSTASTLSYWMYQPLLNGSSSAGMSSMRTRLNASYTVPAGSPGMPPSKAVPESLFGSEIATRA